MKQLATKLVSPSQFTRQDFDEAMALFMDVYRQGQTHSAEQDEELRAWIATWCSELIPPADPASLPRDEYYIALSVNEGIIFSPPDEHKSATLMTWPGANPLLLVAVALLINRCQCDQFSEVCAIIHEFRGRYWERVAIHLPRHAARHSQDKFYTLLMRIIQDGVTDKNED